MLHVSICSGPLLLALTAPVLLCCCSHPQAAITDKLHWVLYGIWPALVLQRLEEGRIHCHTPLLTEQQNKIPLIAKCWVIYQTCIAPVRTMTECSCHCTESSL